MEDHPIRGWVADVLVGGAVGGIVGGLVALNVVLFAGVEQGYEASLREVFGESVLLGVAIVAILAAGPVVGVVMARRVRRRRAGGGRGRPGNASGTDSIP